MPEKTSAADQEEMQPASLGKLVAQAPIPYREFLALCALMMASTALAIDIVLPAMLVMGTQLGAASENAAQWVVTSYLATYALCQLGAGVLADRFGRKPVIIGGMAIYALGALASIFASSFTMLLIGRALAGVGASAGRVCAVALVRDCFKGRDMAAVMSIVMMVFMVVPVIAPLAGQALLELAGWQAIFSFMALFGLSLMVWTLLRLPETWPEERRKPLSFSGVFGAFRLVVTTRASICYALATGVFFGSLFGYINSAAQVYLQIYGLGVWFPLVFSTGGLFVAIASLTNSKIVHRLGMRRLSQIALMVFIAAGLGMLVWALANNNLVPFPVFITGLTITVCCFGFIGTNFNALAMEPLGENAGVGSAVFGFVQMSVSALLGALIGQLYNNTVVPLVAGFVVLGIASLTLAIVAERGKLFGNPTQS